MLYFVLFLLEIIVLFLLSRAISKTLSKFMSINFLAFIFLPGVIIHELAHLFVAVILFVPVGEIEFVPKKHGDSVKLGSVEIAKTDPIRRSIVGFAPVFLGIMLVIGVVYLFLSNLLFFQNQNPYIFIAIVLAVIYLLFAVSNTMFLSSKDMEGTAEISITLLLIFISAYILGFRPPLENLSRIFTKELVGLTQKSTIFLLTPIVIDLLILGIIKLMKR